MVVSQDCINLIKQFEGCRLEAYLCPAGIPTIGFGHTANVKLGQKITMQQAEAFLKSDLAKYEKNVNKFDSIYHWTQNEFDALVSFAYNIGSINALVDNGKRNREQIRAALPNYNKGGGKVLQGLVKRRAAELELFNKSYKPLEVKYDHFKEAVKELQKAINDEYKYNLLIDGIPGSKTLAATPTLNIKVKNTKPKTVKALQKLLTLNGFTCGVDGSFGPKTEQMAKEFQSKIVGLKKPDGEFTAKGKSWKAILKLK